MGRKPLTPEQRERNRAYVRRWQEEHRKHRQAYDKQWREKNRNRLWYQENRERLNEIRRKRYRAKKRSKRAAD
jgi:hypothetical protein